MPVNVVVPFVEFRRPSSKSSRDERQSQGRYNAKGWHSTPPSPGSSSVQRPLMQCARPHFDRTETVIQYYGGAGWLYTETIWLDERKGVFGKPPEKQADEAKQRDALVSSSATTEVGNPPSAKRDGGTRLRYWRKLREVCPNHESDILGVDAA